MPIVQRVHGWLQFVSLGSVVFVVVSELLSCPKYVTLAFGAVSALTGLASYFTGKHTEAKLEAKIETLEREQFGRHLSVEQLRSLTDQLRAIPKPDQSVHLMGVDGNAEAIRLANALKGVLEDAGFLIDGVWEDSLIGGAGPGILIRHAKADAEASVAIQAALLRSGLEAHIVEREAFKRVEIIVSYKPM